MSSNSAHKIVEEVAPPQSDLEYTPSEIVKHLDEYIIAQDDAKRAVAIALRNRWRRMQVREDIRDEITPKNIIMIGPTGVGKTEISRRLAKLSKAPFVKVEATKFTEVGYVGRDVESIIRDLVEVSINLLREEESKKVEGLAKEMAEEKLLNLLLPGSSPDEEEYSPDSCSHTGALNPQEDLAAKQNQINPTREKLRALLRAGEVDEREVEIEITKQPAAHMQLMGPQGFAEIEGQIKDLFQNMVPKQRETRRVKVREARKLLLAEEQERLLDQEKLVELAMRRVETNGVVFIDEIDKVCGGTSASGKGPDVSREGVQRDLLPLVEGSTVSTKYGPVSTDHILFIASGAFHTSKPSDLMPEFQGRFPIRVELSSLTPEHFVRILTEPKNALVLQYQELLRTEGVELEFSTDAIEEIAALTAQVNSKTENIGARRLHTVLEKLLEELSFTAEQHRGEKISIDRDYVLQKLSDVVEDSDLSRYIL